MAYDSWLEMDTDIYICSWYPITDRMFVNFRNEDVGLSTHIFSKSDKIVPIKLNQKEAFNLWKNLNYYFGKDKS